MFSNLQTLVSKLLHAYLIQSRVVFYSFFSPKSPRKDLSSLSIVITSTFICHFQSSFSVNRIGVSDGIFEAEPSHVAAEIFQCFFPRKEKMEKNLIK